MTSGIFVGSAGRVVITIFSVVAAGLLTMFASFVWPTAYRYDHVDLGGDAGSGPVFPVRIHRFTGAAETLMPRGGFVGEKLDLVWVGSAGEQLPPNVITGIQFILSSEESPDSADVFNSTGWTITKLRWDVISRRDSALTVRQLDQPVFIEPNTYASVSFFLGRFGENITIELAAASGIPATSGSPR